MPADWFVRTKEGDSGPFALKDLLGKVQRGEIQPDDRARREGEVWQPIRRLIAAAQSAEPSKTTAPPRSNPPAVTSSQPPIKPAAPQPTEPVAAPKPVAVPVLPKTIAATNPRPSPPKIATPASRMSAGSGANWSRVWIWVGSLIALVAIGIGVYAFRGKPTFPTPIRVEVNHSPERQAARNQQLLATRQKTHLIPGLKDGVPVLVPGLEDWKTAYSLTLSADLKTIVFASLGNPETAYDLYIAERNAPSASFGKPTIIEACISPETDAYPTLSADGLSLIYTSSDSAPILFHTRRTARDQPFGKPERWEAAMKLADGAYIAYPQHFDRDRAAFSYAKGGNENRKFVVLGRPDLATDQAEPIPVIDPWEPYFFAKSELRGYYSTANGLEYVYRTRKDEKFSTGESLLSAEKIGPTEGSVWVTPSEDVVFFCGPGIGGKLAVVRQLWMVQF